MTASTPRSSPEIRLLPGKLQTMSSVMIDFSRSKSRVRSPVRNFRAIPLFLSRLA
jgi:hypothetical protein